MFVAIAIVVAGGVGGQDRATAGNRVRIGTAVLPRGTSHNVPMCEIIFFVVFLAK